MRKLFREFFYVPKYGKVREKVMITQVAMSIVIIVACLAAMSLSAYAFFSYNVSSGSNIIKGAHFETSITIQITDENGKVVNINPITSNYQTHKAEGLEPGKYYTVTIAPTANSTATTGYVVITADGCNDTYHTQQLGMDKNVTGGITPSVSFELMITDETNVIFLAHWGTSSYYDTYQEKGDSEVLYITQNEKITMVINDPDVNTEKVPISTTPAAGAATGTNSPSAQTQVSVTIPSAESTKPEENTNPETAATSEPTSAADPSVTTTEPSATQPTETAETTVVETTETAAPEPTETTVTEPTETTITETAETTVSETTEQTQPTEETPGALATEASEYNAE